ncbi:MAG: right-handed parallel beta-helix repeat-containing protein, partial [Candidatus Omnitrophica bacterium]|nr:right-handed parallel beta-helix repeat-containing protein [Candidatus Omnitrophota bacterium]
MRFMGFSISRDENSRRGAGRVAMRFVIYRIETEENLKKGAEKMKKINFNRLIAAFAVLFFVGLGFTFAKTAFADGPVVIITSPANGDHVDTDTPVIEYTVTGGSITSFIVDGTELAPDNIPASGTALAHLDDGARTISITAVDGATNETIATSIFTVDTLDPVVAITAPADTSVLNGLPITISGTVTEDNIESVTLTLVLAGGDPIAPIDLTADAADGNFSTDVGSLADGDYTITVECVDLAGNDHAPSVGIELDAACVLTVRITDGSGTIEASYIGGDPIIMTENAADGIRTYETTLTYGSDVQLTAASTAGYVFKRWGGDTFGDSEITTINSIILDMVIFAYFSEDGAEYHVDPSDANASDDLSCGSAGTPFASLDYALNFLMPGNTLTLHQGIYGSIVIDSTVSGTEGNLVSFIGDGEVIIDGTGQDEAMLLEGNYILIRNFKLTKGGSYGLKITGDNITAERCDIYDNGLHGLYAQDVSNITIDNCVLRDNAGDGINLSGGAEDLIQNCVSSSNGADGIALFGADDCIVRYSIALKNGGAGFSMGDAASLDATLYNNIAYDNTGNGFNIAVTDAILLNNIANENGGDVVVDLPLEVDYNYWGDGVFVVDHDANLLCDSADGPPGFVNTEDLDVVTDLSLPNFGRCYGLRLKQSSICLDSGVALGVGANSDPVLFTVDMTDAG